MSGVDFMGGQTAPEIADALDKKITPRQISSSAFCGWLLSR